MKKKVGTLEVPLQDANYLCLMEILETIPLGGNYL